MRTWHKIAIAAALLGTLGLGGPAPAAEITVLLNQATESGVRELASAFEKASGHKVVVSFQGGPNLNQKINAWLDRYVKGTNVAVGPAVSARTETCPQTAASGGP